MAIFESFSILLHPSLKVSEIELNKSVKETYPFSFFIFWHFSFSNFLLSFLFSEPLIFNISLPKVLKIPLIKSDLVTPQSLAILINSSTSSSLLVNAFNNNSE